MKSIALNFVRWFLKNNSCDLLNEVVIRCEIVATKFYDKVLYHNLLNEVVIRCEIVATKFYDKVLYHNLLNECSE